MIYPIYAKDMLKMCPRYAQDMPKIRPKYAQDMPHIPPTYMTKIYLFRHSQGGSDYSIQQTTDMCGQTDRNTIIQKAKRTKYAHKYRADISVEKFAHKCMNFGCYIEKYAGKYWEKIIDQFPDKYVYKNPDKYLDE